MRLKPLLTRVREIGDIADQGEAASEAVEERKVGEHQEVDVAHALI